MFRIVGFWSFLFFLSVYSTYAQRKGEFSVTELNNRSVILNHIDDYCKAYANKDSVFFKDYYARSSEFSADGKIIDSDQFLQNFKMLFKGNQSLEASVENIKIVRHPVKTYFYGVNMVMTCRIGEHIDKGYVFWLIDLKNIDHVTIHLFSWQPYETTPEEDVFGIGDFQLTVDNTKQVIDFPMDNALCFELVCIHDYY